MRVGLAASRAGKVRILVNAHVYTGGSLSHVGVLPRNKKLGHRKNKSQKWLSCNCR